jgi:hypothetical protein
MKTFGNGLVVVALATLPVVASPAAEGSFERTLTVTGPVELDVRGGAGDIVVRAGPAGSVVVKARIRATDRWLGGLSAEEKVRRIEANPPIEQTGNFIRLGRFSEKELERNVSISYDLVVPFETKLRADTGSGDVRVGGLRGPVNVDTGSGRVEAADIGGDVTIDTGSGDVVLSRIRGDVRADTGSGSIEAVNVGGGCWADTGSGDVRVEFSGEGAGDHRVSIDTGSGNASVEGARGLVEVDTGSGDIRVRGEPTARWKLSAGSGSITATLPPQAAFELQAHTNSGRIESSHPITVLGEMGRRQLRGKVRGGGPLVSIETGSGNIRLN